MITYPSTHGVYEEGVDEICKIIHDNGGQVYMDGANMNAQVCSSRAGCKSSSAHHRPARLVCCQGSFTGWRYKGCQSCCSGIQTLPAQLQLRLGLHAGMVFALED